MSGSVVHGVWEVTEVAHGEGLPKQVHLPVVPGSTHVKVVNWTEVVLPTTDEAGAGLGQAAHLLPHLQAVVGGHGYPEEAKSRCPTGRKILN